MLHSVAGPLRSGTRALLLGGFTFAVTQTAVMHRALTPVYARQALRERWMRRWARGLLAVFGVARHWASALPPPTRAGHGRLVVANHRSPLDIILMLECCGGGVLARHDLKSWPLLGWAARHGDTIFVERDDPRSGVQAIREIRRRLAEGRTVIVFPEGTTHRGDQVHSFQGGAFSAIRGLDAELLPIGIAYEPGVEFVGETFVRHLTRVAQRKRTRVAICVGELHAPQRDREAMAAQMQRAVQDLVHRARAALG